MHAKLAESNVLTCNVSMPLLGAWVATVESDSDISLSGTLDLSFSDGTVLRGTVVSGESIHGKFTCRLVGGNGKLGTTLDARAYAQTAFILPVREAVGDSGEALDASVVSNPLLDNRVTRYLRHRNTAGRIFSDLAREIGCLWRVTLEGKILFTVDSYLAFQTEFEVTNDLPLSNAQEIAAEKVIYPGVSLKGKQVIGVEHSLSKTAFRSVVRYG